MKVVDCKEIAPQSSSDDSDSDDELFDYLNMSQKTGKQAKKDLNKDDSTEKKGKISNSNTVNIDLNKDDTKASMKINELSSIFTKVGTTESLTTNEEGSTKTEHSHQHETQTFFQQDMTSCHDEKGNPLLSAKVISPNPESNSDDEIQMIQETCMSDDRIFDNTEQGIVESTKSKENCLNSSGLDMDVGKNYCASDNLGIFETNKMVLFGAKSVASTQLSLVNEIVSEQFREFKENKYHANLQVYQGIGGEECDLIGGRKEINKSNFVEHSSVGLNFSPVDVKASQKELQNNPVLKTEHTYNASKETNVKPNEVFIPDMNKTPLPIQYKFVRNGSKLVRVAVVQDTADPDIVYDGIYDHQQTTNNNVEPIEDKQNYEQYTAVIADIDVDNSYAESVDDDSGFETGSGLCETARIDESCIQTGTGDIEKVQGDSCQFVTTETDIVEKSWDSLMEDGDSVNIKKKYLVDSENDIVKKTDSDFVEYFENTCFSENASTSSQISLCSNESPIVLKVDPDGKLSECTKCPASVAIAAPILQEKKTEMDISYLSMKIQKLENDILEMKRVAEKSNEIKDCSQVKNKLGENEVNLSKTRMKDVDSQTKGIETKTVVNNVDKSMDADKIYGHLKETVIDYKKTNNEGNHGLLKKITEEAVTDTNTDNNEKARARKCIPLKEKAVDSHMSISDETKGKRKRNSQKKVTTYSSPNTCAGNNKRISRGCKSHKEKAIDSTTNATDNTKSFEEKAADSSESTDNKITMPHSYIPQKKKATGSCTNVDDDAKTICLQQRSKKLKICGGCNTVNDNEMLNERKDKPQKEIAESNFKSFDKNGTNDAVGRSIKRRKQPATSLNIPPKKKPRQTRSLFNPEHFKATERYDIVSPKSLSGKNLSDEESQDETDDYMIYNEEYLQKLYQQKLNEVRHIQNALKRMRQKSECSIETQSETKTMNKYCTEESETEENVDIQSNAKVVRVKRVSMGKKTCDTKRNCRKVIGSNMSNVTENLSSNMNTDSTSSMNLSTKSKNLSTKSKPSSRLKGKSRKSRVTKRVTWSEKSNRTSDTSSAEPNHVIDSTTNLTVICMPAQHDWKNVPTNEKRVQEENKKRSRKKSAIIHWEESAVSESNKDLHHEREHLVICKGNKTANSLDDTGSTPDCVLKQNRKRKVETSCINTRKSVQVKRKSGQTAKEETSTSDAGKEGNEKDINRLNYQVNNPVTEFLTSDKSFSRSENIEQKRNRLESIISEKLKFKNTENVVDSQLKVDDQGQGLAKNASYSCSKPKVSRKKVDKNVDTLITKNKPRPKVSARKSKLRGVCAVNENLNKKSKDQVSKNAGKQKSGSDQSTKSRKMAARSHPARLAFEKSCDYTWKEKLDSDAFFLNLQTKQGKTRRPLNVKKIIKKILVPKDSSGKKSDFTKRSKHLKRHKVEKSKVTPSVKHTFSDSDDAVQSDTAYLSDNNVSVMSFPGMKLSKGHGSPEKLASGKEGNNDLVITGENKETAVQNNKDVPIIGDNKRTSDTSKVSVRQSSFDHKKLEHLEKNIPLKSEKGVDLIAGQENKTICIEIHESPSETEEVEIEKCLIRGKSNNNSETSQKKVNGIPQTSPTSPRYMKTFDQIRSLLDRKKNTCTRSTVQQQLSFLEES